MAHSFIDDIAKPTESGGLRRLLSNLNEDTKQK